VVPRYNEVREQGQAQASAPAPALLPVQVQEHYPHHSKYEPSGCFFALDSIEEGSLP
jgi:hypothetical protein